jgi:predicted TIM-barrel fold metal-dependent hydrolase
MDKSLDGDWGAMVAKLVSESTVDYGVVLGFAGAIHAETKKLNLETSQMIIPSGWVFQLAETYSNLLPGPSINPHAEDALHQLEEVIARRAVLIKWLPSAQLIDPADRSLVKFYQRVQESGIPLLIHCGGERTFESYQPNLNNVSRLELPLSLGVKVICAHSASRVIGSGDPDEIPELKALFKRYDNLWVDNSGICNPSRFSHLPRLASDAEIESRTLYGSDWPVPANSYYYLGKLGIRRVLQLESEKNWITRDIAIKKEFGYSEDSLTRANSVLANLDYWTNR